MRQEFQARKLNDKGQAEVDMVGQILSEALTRLEAMLPPPNREHSSLVTKLQEAAFYARRGVSLRPENQLEEAK